jgi:type I restriction enzyme S subunit
MTKTSTRAMKDSGVEWIGQIPEQWNSIQLKWLSPVRRGSSPRPIDDPAYFDDEGDWPWVRIADVSNSDGRLRSTKDTLSDLGSSLSTKLEAGSLFVSIAGTVGKPCISEIQCCIHDGFVYFPDLKFDKDLLFRIFEAGECYAGLGKWGTQLNLNTDTIGSIFVAVPPPDEQKLIASFLNRETAQIDTLIDKQQQLIETLAERRKAVITRAVTRGLDPTAPMKPSGVEWLGEIPAHWAAANVKRAYRLTLGKMVNAGDLAGGIEMAYLRAGNIQETGVDISEVKTMTFTPAEATTLTLLAGDVVVVEGGGGYGRSDFLKHDLVGWGFQNHVIRARPSAGHSGKFFDYFVKFLRGIGHFEKLSSFATIPNVSAEKLGSIEFPIASQIEQEEIVSYLDAETGAMDALALKASSVIELLKERRQALISAAVTGKIDVRGIA